VGRGGSAVSS